MQRILVLIKAKSVQCQISVFNNLKINPMTYISDSDREYYFESGYSDYLSGNWNPPTVWFPVFRSETKQNDIFRKIYEKGWNKAKKDEERRSR